MSSLNKVILIGHLGKDPESRHMPNGDAVANFSIATSERWVDKKGEKHEQTEWHNCVAFRKTAELVAEYVRKGSQVCVEGKIRTEKWTDKDNVERWTTKVYVDSVVFLSRTDKPKQEAPQEATKKDAFSDLEDDIPF